jgi:hypothetical protein
MIVLSNSALGPRAELIVSDIALQDMLRAVARAAAPLAKARWELELVRWLEARAASACSIDVAEIAWTPEHFENQRAFVVGAIARARDSSYQAGALARWSRMIEAHPPDAVVCGRRWSWAAGQPEVTTG